MATAQAFHLRIISPAAVIVDDQVPQVEIPGVEGDFGVLPGHSPLFSMIRPGVINITLADGSHRKFFATAGYADVTPESCTVISDQIQDLAEIAPDAADEALVEARAALARAETVTEKTAAEKLVQAADALATALKAA